MTYFLVNFIHLLFRVLYFAVLIRILITWIPVDPNNRLIRLLDQITEPLLAPARRLIPPIGGLDFSPMVVLMVLFLAENFIVRLLV